MQPVFSPLKLVAIGGGTGLATLLTGLKPYLDAGQRASDPPCHEVRLQDDLPFSQVQLALTAIVTMTDDGKSSGRLRSEFGMSPPGDIRNCLVALAREDRFLKSLFKHRFAGSGSLGGHSLGNLILVALSQMNENFLAAVEKASALLGCAARVLPSTLDLVDLEARIGDQMAYGQRAIKALRMARGLPIRNLAVTPATAQALPEAVEAILAADLITLGPGSLFTSVLPNLLIKGIAEALSQSRARKIYICNLMTEADETEGLSAADHVGELLRFCPALKLDYAVFNSRPISPTMRELYAEEEAVMLEPPNTSHFAFGDVQFICKSLASEARSVRHNPANLARAIFEIYYNV
ncbi:MAG TPA: gluconeogenesis factor YvcK family protein [Blastocatellia bacterium]|nr:gluconeogenesis factor YvcK family protein [Blastocatellia bacterium]